MSISPEDLDRINGPGSYDTLMAARKENNRKRLTPEALEPSLGQFGVRGVVRPEDSRAIHSGEVPIVKLNPSEVFDNATPISELTTEQLAETLESRKIDVVDQGSETAVDVNHQ